MDIIHSHTFSEFAHLKHGTIRNNFLPGTKEMDVEHAKELFEGLDIDWKRAVLMNQVHGDNIAIVKDIDGGSGFLENKPSILETDSLMTNVFGITLIVRTGDCVPVLLYDSRNNVIAALHAGWKGTVLQLTKKTVIEMGDIYGTQPSDIDAYIGPSICVDNYEVSQAPDDRVEKFESLFGMETVKREGDKVYIDVKAANRIQLQELGVQHIEVSEYCTADRIHSLPSHYRDGDSRREQLLTYIQIHA